MFKVKDEDGKKTWKTEVISNPKVIDLYLEEKKLREEEYNFFFLVIYPTSAKHFNFNLGKRPLSPPKRKRKSSSSCRNVGKEEKIITIIITVIK